MDCGANKTPVEIIKESAFKAIYIVYIIQQIFILVLLVNGKTEVH